MRQAVVGLLAHVDAGKTTLAEALLWHAGVIRQLGRVDHGDTHLDTDQIERSRGITVFSSSATLDHGEAHLMLLDTPGHVDFSAETERTLAVLDLAVLVVGANDGVTGHTHTLMRLLERHGVPTVIFVNKTDLENPGRDALLAQLNERLVDGCADYSDLASETLAETAAATDEDALDEYLETGALSDDTLRRLVLERRVTPVLFGSALRDDGVTGLLDLLAWLAQDRTWPEAFAARAFKVTHEKGERVTWLKVTGGTLRAKDLLEGVARDGAWAEKVNQVRVYTGARFELVPFAAAGQICAVTGLSHVIPGDALGAEPTQLRPVLAPVLAYRVDPGDLDEHTVFSALRELAEEDPMLGVAWDDELGEIRLMLMGAVQLEVVRDRMRQRLGTEVTFGQGSILYKETIAAPIIGYGHYEPLRHYAEAHLLLEPLPRGAGMEYGTVCSVDDLSLNWQRLILTHAMEREHRGALIAAPITDLRITLVSGKAHLKHTEGGDFRQATYRAIRQGLMTAKERGDAVLLEPWYRFTLEVPPDKVGRALADLTRMYARFGTPGTHGEMAVIEGELPASELGDYALDVAAYTSGQGSISCVLSGYEPCHDAERVIEAAAYNYLEDLPNTPDSVFYSHGAGYNVWWNRATEMMHVKDDPSRQRPWRAADASFFATTR
ncbi:MAG: TetM/TetW/TetO/TetS family tetracycline resistance ribosomal protection protein [Atopobiaceae bacterium]|nr:TetM/TetW/TetO/TetS family tetracycline resistance ribosomal protection protein [Atopobiaceae bacterium]